MSRTTRKTKTPAERAQEALEVVQRHVDRLTTKVTALRAELETTETEWNQAIVRRDYLAKHPDLPNNTNRAPNQENQ
ncbi:hypothetical protein [Nocardioides speluncae]|uniref:hypothetical protein n=1 Tax=Nocardioides speluncae TaxID=2670337 RepID=UPI000D68E511|nr:hypothetical protein [Nocardioides speluncae]